MMHNPPIAVSSYTSIRDFYPEPIPNAAELDPRGRWPWLQRKFLALVAWAGGKQPLRTLERPLTYAELSLDDLFKSVCESQWNIRLIWNREAKYVVVGREMLDRLRIEPDFARFSVPPSYRHLLGVDGQQCPLRFCGLIIVLCPWVSGLFLLPNLEKE